MKTVDLAGKMEDMTFIVGCIKACKVNNTQNLHEKLPVENTRNIIVGWFQSFFNFCFGRTFFYEFLI